MRANRTSWAGTRLRPIGLIPCDFLNSKNVTIKYQDIMISKDTKSSVVVITNEDIVSVTLLSLNVENNKK